MSTGDALTDDVARAAQILRDGGLVAFPTETVYGLGADAASSSALRRLYAVKGRPPSHPVIVHLGASASLDDFARDVPDVARALAGALWPGPCTIVLRARRDRIAPEVTGGGDTVGLRVPNHALALALLDAFGGGVAAPSANRFGRVSPTTAAHVTADLGADVDFVLDGGPCDLGVESTIVDCTGASPVVLRVGGVAVDAVAEVVGTPVELRTSGEVAAPGTLPSHYAPEARVEVVDPVWVSARAHDLARKSETVGVLCLRTDLPRQLPEAVVVLEPPSDVDEYARVLYARLREADALGVTVVLAVPPPDDGVGAAIVDRLRRAAG